jgi:ParB/RepB/Spo0J family partition protein
VSPAPLCENPPAPRLEQAWADPIVRLPLAKLVRHPDNRVPLAADIAERAESIKRRGILEPIIARLLSDGRYQVLSGETRWKASEQLGAIDIAARVAECSDAEALELLAECNAQRKDLNQIEKARLIDRLCQHTEEGGGGLKREQAARIYGLETAAAASNLVRLLELPKAWQDRVASGELPWTWAREIVPYVKAGPVLEELEKDWKDRSDARDWQPNAFKSRQDLTERLDDIVCELPQLKDARFDASDEKLRERLGVIELAEPNPVRKGKPKLLTLVTNTKLYDELDRKAREDESKQAVAKDGRDDAPPQRKLSPAEQKQKAQARGKLRGERVAWWRDKLLRRAIDRKLLAGQDSGLRLVLAYAASPAYRGPSFADLVCKATDCKVSTDGWGTRSHYWRAVCDLKLDARRDLVLKTLAHNLLQEEAPDWRQPTLPHALVEALAEDLRVDVAEAWVALQPTGSAVNDAGAALLEEFFLLHQTEELRELAGELGVHLPPTVKTRAQMVKLLLSVPQGTSRRLPLPKSIKPLAIAGGKSKGRKARK